ncbi:carbohydrate-binding protein [Streptomyces stramineus]
MTAGNNGTGTPENDDPFAHLYRSEGGDRNTDSGQAAPQPGVPRTSHHQVRPVGSRQYGQQPPRQQPAPHYAAPETLPGGAPRQPAPPQGGHGGGARPNRRGLLIAAIAVVVVVAGGIGAAMVANSGGEKDDAKTSAGAAGDDKPEADEKDKGKEKEPDKKESGNPSAAGLQKRDAASLRLLGGATTAHDVPKAKADGGLYITGLNAAGAGVEWEVEVKSAYQYRLDVSYGVPGKDGQLTVTANSDPGRPIRMDNFGGTSESDWAKGYGWKNTWSLVELKQGKNKIKLSCESGNKCDVVLDQLSIRKG